MSLVEKFLEKGVETNRIEICHDQQSRFFLQYECQESNAVIKEKKSSGFWLAVMEIVTAVIVMYTLNFNKEKTEKLGKLYDELNITADDYTLYANVNSRHR